MGEQELKVNIAGQWYVADLRKPMDISIPLRHGSDNPKAWQAKDPDFSPVKAGDFVGSVRQGSPVNFYEVFFNPHGNGTHTECVGHIAPEQYPVHEALSNQFFPSLLASIQPNEMGNDRVMDVPHFDSLHLDAVNALVIRTLPNKEEKKSKDFSGTNPPYLTARAMEFLVSKGIKHLLIDLPSVDKEADGGKLAAHKAFWQYPQQPRMKATITEMIFVPDQWEDGMYLLNIQIPPFMLDATPSRPFLFPLERGE